MSTTRKAVLGCLVPIGLAVVVLGVVIVLNWQTVSENFVEAVETHTERAGTTLFRLGELMSISVVLETEYGSKPDLTYDSETGVRILTIAFRDYTLPEGATAEGHARQIARSAVGATKHSDKIDRVDVLLENSDPFSLELNEAR